MQNEDEKKHRIGVYLGAEPYVGGSFQYNQSIIYALAALPKENFEIVAFYANDLWEDYLTKFSFRIKKIYHRRQLGDVFGAIFFKIIKIGNLNLYKYREIYAKFSKFSHQFDDEKLDLIIFPAQEIFPAMIKTKSVAVVHDLMHRYESFPENSSQEEFFGREMLYSSISNASSIIFVDSDLGASQLVESYGEHLKDKITVMPFTPPQYLFEEDNDVVPDVIKLPKKFIFYPAQFWKHKNHKNLLLATSLLKEKGINVTLVFVGSKKNGYAEIMELIKSLNLQNNVDVLGYVSDSLMKLLYKKARAMVMPTYFGPTNIPPLEGMAMGCPVAVSRRYAMPWQVGDAGLTFDPDDINEMSGVIEKLWCDDDLCEKLIIKGKERVKYFSQDEFNLRFKKAVLQLL